MEAQKYETEGVADLQTSKNSNTLFDLDQSNNESVR